MPFGCVTLGDKKNYNQPSEVTDRYDLDRSSRRECRVCWARVGRPGLGKGVGTQPMLRPGLVECLLAAVSSVRSSGPGQDDRQAAHLQEVPEAGWPQGTEGSKERDGHPQDVSVRPWGGEGREEAGRGSEGPGTSSSTSLRPVGVLAHQSFSEGFRSSSAWLFSLLPG